MEKVWLNIRGMLHMQDMTSRINDQCDWSREKLLVIVGIESFNIWMSKHFKVWSSNSYLAYLSKIQPANETTSETTFITVVLFSPQQKNRLSKSRLIDVTHQ